MRTRQLCAVTAVVLLASASCSKSADDCSYTASCGVADVEKVDSGASCNPACGGSTPVCKLPVAGAGAGTGSCVACTPSDESACAGYSCNPTTNSCTTTRVGTVSVCHACVSDSECAPGARGPSARCVAMSFRGAPHGSYCLNRVSAGACTQPFTVSLTAASASGVPAEAYCGINQEATTCEALVDLIAGKTCTRNSNCGSGQDDGLCETFGNPPTQSMRCSIPCTASAQCSQSQTCTSVTNGYCR